MCRHLIWIFSCMIVPSAVFAYEIIRVPAPRANVAEGPTWDASTLSLYYVDLLGTNIYRYDYMENIVYTAKIVGLTGPSFILGIKGRKHQVVVGFADRTVRVVRWNGRSGTATALEVLFAVEQSSKFALNRMCDGKADPKGRIYAGTYRRDQCTQNSAPAAGFYRWSRKNGVKKLFRNISISNGIAENRKQKTFYYIDSCDLNVREYNFDGKGHLFNGRVAFTFKTGHILPDYIPDGMTIDDTGLLHIALLHGGSVVIADPKTSSYVGEIRMPVKDVTSVTFGGPEMDILFVTTASIPPNIYSSNMLEQNMAGDGGFLYMITNLGAKGHQPHKVCI